MADARPDSEVGDLATARALIATLRHELTTVQRENASLRHQLDVLCQRMFGKKAERGDPRQLQLALEQLANEPGPVTEPIEMDSGETPVRSHARRRPTGRRPLPAHLPRHRVEIDVADADKVCGCGHAKARIGESISAKLEYHPASFVVIETARAKYACPQCHAGVVEAPAPPQATEKSLAAEGLLAHVVVSKYVDHLPLHRLSGIFARQGVDLSRTTLCDWIADVATALAPIGEQLRRAITAATYLQTDDTTVTVLDDRGGSFNLKAACGPISTRSGGRLSSTRRRRMNARARRPSWPSSRARTKPTPTRATTRCIEAGTCSESGAGPTGVAGSSRRS